MAERYVDKHIQDREMWPVTYEEVSEKFERVAQEEEHIMHDITSYINELFSSPEFQQVIEELEKERHKEEYEAVRK